jgi:hypothetical protein
MEGIHWPLMNMGAFGLVCAIVWHVFRHTIPRLADDFKTSLAEQRQDFRDELRLERDDFKEALQDLGCKIEKLADRFSELNETVKENVPE